MWSFAILLMLKGNARTQNGSKVQGAYFPQFMMDERQGEHDSHMTSAIEKTGILLNRPPFLANKARSAFSDNCIKKVLFQGLFFSMVGTVGLEPTRD